MKALSAIAIASLMTAGTASAALVAIDNSFVAHPDIIEEYNASITSTSGKIEKDAGSTEAVSATHEGSTFLEPIQ